MTIFDDLSLLRSFLAIVESGSLSAAARKLRLTQPTLSRRLRALEEKCDAVLLRRDTHRMGLTDAGRRVLEDARAMLELAEEAQGRLRGDQAAVAGPLRLFATIDFGQSVVSRLIASFLQTHPAVTVALAYSNRPLHMIEEGCDAGIVAGSPGEAGVVARSLGPIRRHAVASPEFLRERPSATTPGDLGAWPWLALSGEQFGGSRTATFLHAEQAPQTLAIRPVMVSEGVTSLREAARLGLGVATLPEWLIGEDLVSGRLVRVLPDWRATDLTAHAVYPAQRRLPPRVRAFVDFAVAYMTAILKPRCIGRPLA